jgi:phage FluMu protein Com
MPDLRCPKCNRKLAQIEDDGFMGIVDERRAEGHKGVLFIKCPKCKEIARFGGLRDPLHA